MWRLLDSGQGRQESLAIDLLEQAVASLSLI
jgi:hypothetical protein